MFFINKKELFLLEVLVKKNFSSKYKDSVLGVMWTILSPLLMMALFTIIFATLFSRNIKNFSVFFLCGWCIFQFFSSAINVSMMSLKVNRSILQRNPAPKYIFVLASIISEFLNYLIMLILLICVMMVTHAPFYPTMLLLFLPIIPLCIMTTGLGLMLSIVCVYYTDVKHLWNVISLMLMYASAIFYPITIVPEPYRQYLMLSPLYWAINQFRCLVFDGTIPQISNLANSLLLSLIILVLGIIIFKKYESKVAIKF